MPDTEVMATSTIRPQIGQVSGFEPDSEQWQSYVERLELFFTLNEITDKVKMAAMLLHLVGRDTYMLVRNLCSPKKPTDLTYEALVKLVQGHFNPTPNVIVERFKFHRRKQLDIESITEYATILKKMAMHCDFGKTLDERLRDKLIDGIKDDTILERLLGEKELTFQTAFETALSMETAMTDVKEIKGKQMNIVAPQNINKVGVAKPHQPYRDKGPTASNFVSKPKANSSKVCYRCGRGPHHINNCPAKDAICHYCHRKGHFKSQCSTLKKKGSKPEGKSYSSNYMATADDIFPFYHLNSTNNRSDPICLEILFDNTMLMSELDTGSAITAISEQLYEDHFAKHKLLPTQILLRSYTGKLETPKGVINIPVKHQEQQATLEVFVVAGNGHPILGRSFLHKFQINWKAVQNRFQVNVHQLKNATSSNLLSILEKYKSLFSEDMGEVKNYQARIYLKKGARPKFCKARSLAYALRDKVDKDLDRLERLGVITKTENANWATPIVPVEKSDGTVRICGDYSVTVNPDMESYIHPLPKIDDLLTKLAGGEKFSVVDCRFAYHLIRVDEESKKLLTINTHRGLYTVNRLPFGVPVAAAIFQEIMDRIIADLPFVAAYQDDIIITGRNDLEHLQNLEKLLKRLEEAGLRLARNKCFFMQDKVKYLGYEITKDGISPNKEKLTAILNSPPPRSVKQLRSFLGMLNYYGKFIDNMSTTLEPLHRLLEKNRRWIWSKDAQMAFNRVKNKLSDSNLLVHYDSKLPLELFCDASDYGLGAVLAHRMPDKTCRPIAFASRTLSKSERNYGQIHKEALALVFGVRKFHQYLFGCNFTLWTDHQPLTYIFDQKNGIPKTTTLKIQRWGILLSGYQYKIKYLRSEANAVADMLSRLPLDDDVEEEPFFAEIATINLMTFQNLPITSQEIAKDTQKDKALRSAYHFTRIGWPEQNPRPELLEFFNKRRELEIEMGCLLWRNRVVIPKLFQRQILTELHSGHMGMTKMKGLARTHVWWPSIDSDIEEIVKNCKNCQNVRDEALKVPVHPWDYPSGPWMRVHADFAGPCFGTMFLVIVDAYSKWPEVIPMKSTTSAATIDVFRKLFLRYGLPLKLVTDNGPQFSSHEFANFILMNGIKHTFSPPYHPATNGAAENLVKTAKHSITASVRSGISVTEACNRFLGVYRTTPHSTTRETPSKLFLGREMRTRFHLTYPNFKDKMESCRQKQHDSRHAQERILENGNKVFARDYRRNRKWSTGTVTRVIGDRTYDINFDDGFVGRRHIEQIRLKKSDDESKQEQIPNSETGDDVEHNIPVPIQPAIGETRTNDKDTLLPDSTILPVPSSSNETETVQRRSQRERKPRQRLIEEM